MYLLRWLPIDLCHPRCAAMTTSTGLSIPWRCPSMIYVVFLCDACHPPFLEVWSSSPYHYGLETRPNYDNLRCVTVHIKSSRRPARILTFLPYILICFMLSVWYAKHSPIAFVFKSLDSPVLLKFFLCRTWSNTALPSKCVSPSLHVPYKQWFLFQKGMDFNGRSLLVGLRHFVITEPRR